MSNKEIDTIMRDLRKAEDIDSLYILIDENIEILHDDELFKKIISLLEEEKRDAKNDLQSETIQQSEEDIQFYKQEISNINIIIGVLNQRKAMEQDRDKRMKKIQEEYPFLTGDSKFKIFFSGFSLDDIENIPKNKLPTVLGWIESQLATKLLIDNAEGIKHVNERKNSRLSDFNVRFDRTRIGALRIGFYRKGNCTVIIGIGKKTGNDRDYERYDSVARKIEQIEREREDFLSGTLSSDSDHQKIIEIIYQKLMSLYPEDEYPLEDFIPDIEETFAEGTRDITEIVGSYHSEWYYMYETLKGIYNKYSSIDDKVLEQFPEVDFIKWIKEQKKLFRAGKLKPKRVKLLEELGIQFNHSLEDEPSKKDVTEEEPPKQVKEETEVWENPLLSLRIQELESLGDEFLTDFQTVVDYYQTRGTLKTAVGLKSDIDAINVRQILRKWKRSSFKETATPLQLQLVNELLKLKEPNKHQIKELDVSKDEQDRLDSETIDKILDLTEAYYLTYGTTRIPPHYKVDGLDLGEYLEKLRQLVSIPGAVSKEQAQRIKELSKDSVEETEHHTEVNELFASEERRVEEKKAQLKDMIDEMSEEEIDTLIELLRNTSSK